MLQGLDGVPAASEVSAIERPQREISLRELIRVLRGLERSDISKRELTQLAMLAEHADDPEAALREQVSYKHSRLGWLFAAAVALSVASAVGMPVVYATAPSGQGPAAGFAIACLGGAAITTAAGAVYVYRKAQYVSTRGLSDRIAVMRALLRICQRR